MCCCKQQYHIDTSYHVYPPICTNYRMESLKCAASQLHTSRGSYAQIHPSTSTIFLVVAAATNDVDCIRHCGRGHIAALQGHGCSRHPLMGVSRIINGKLTQHLHQTGRCNQRCQRHVSRRTNYHQPRESPIRSLRGTKLLRDHAGSKQHRTEENHSR